MASDSAPINLTNHFLIAMPGMRDELFGKSVVFMCEHSERGALGLIINKPSDITLPDLFDKVELPLGREDLKTTPVFLGGPVQTERGFVLHDAVGKGESVGATMPSATTEPAADAGAGDRTGDEADDASDDGGVYASTLSIPGGLEMTTSKDVLEAMASGGGPPRVLVSLGYSSWGQGQLESEITENSWLTVAADPRLIFEVPVEQRYDQAMALLGLEAWMLGPEAGHA